MMGRKAFQDCVFYSIQHNIGYIREVNIEIQKNIQICKKNLFCMFNKRLARAGGAAPGTY